MPTMKAVQVAKAGGHFELIEREIPSPKENEVLLRVQACGICHTDALTLTGGFPSLKYPIIPGHEVIGVIDKVDNQVAKRWRVGQRVGVGWHGGHCGQCPACRLGDFWHCEQALITGISCDGGYAEYMLARPEALFAIPEVFSSAEAAPLLCAGNTVFGALKNSGAHGGDLVAIVGLGGLGHLAIQFAHKLGYHTAALSRGSQKKALALKLGAHFYLDTDAADVNDELQKLGGAKAMICTAPNANLIAQLLPGLAFGGRMIVVSFSKGMIEIPHQLLLGGEKSISGWAGDTVSEMLQFSALSNTKPMIEQFPLAQVEEAFKKVMDSTVRFRAVLDISSK